MSSLRAKMIEQLQLHRKAPGTQEQYVKAIYQLAAYYKRSPDQLSSQEIRRYLHYLLTERQLSWSSCNVVAAAIRFFSVDTLGCTPMQLNLPPRPAQKHLPRVLSVEQLEHLFATTHHPKPRALLMTAYAAGLRVSEVVRLQVNDLESDPSRMLIRINQGKGNKVHD
jgi:integrase/recombinase XerD